MKEGRKDGQTDRRWARFHCVLPNPTSLASLYHPYTFQKQGERIKPEAIVSLMQESFPIPSFLFLTAVWLFHKKKPFSTVIFISCFFVVQGRFEEVFLNSRLIFFCLFVGRISLLVKTPGEKLTLAKCKTSISSWASIQTYKTVNFFFPSKELAQGCPCKGTSSEIVWAKKPESMLFFFFTPSPR